MGLNTRTAPKEVGMVFTINNLTCKIDILIPHLQRYCKKVIANCLTQIQCSVVAMITVVTCCHCHHHHFLRVKRTFPFMTGCCIILGASRLSMKAYTVSIHLRPVSFGVTASFLAHEVDLLNQTCSHLKLGPSLQNCW